MNRLSRWRSIVIITLTIALPAGIVIFTLISLLIKPAPELGPVLPDYPNTLFHKTANITYSSNGFQNQEITLDCGSGIFGVEDYVAYSTNDTSDKIVSFYQQILAKTKFNEQDFEAKDFLVGRGEKVLVSVSTKIRCFHKRSSAREYPGYALIFLDPKIPAEAEVIKSYVTTDQVKGLVFLVTRGFILYR